MQKLLRLVTFVFLLWLGGFFVFVATLPREGDPAVAVHLLALQNEQTGIIALTGGGGRRIGAAVDLLAERRGRKVLISGVHPDTRKEELAAQFTGSDLLFDCCIDIGKRALTTKGNAIETRDWVQAEGFNTAILVTTDYHVPRARAEIHAIMPELNVVVWPVASKSAPAEGWLTSSEAWRVLMTEYMKFLAVRLGQLLPLS
ncbi:YdcF family protein [Parvularcula sp. IMCC14364]|uniref:YdcF family protein n=1 Tax=Parvularcula sp. IMCC14364 TaxID=3067902 RepID=UPI002740AB50|nr:YdcF family protein [Parvularcula sp. IMCC14364]